MKKPQKTPGRIRLTVMIALLMFTVLYSCTPFYIANPVFAPMFEEAGQIKAIGSVGNSGYGIQAGVSVTDNLGFTVGLSGTEHATEVKGRITEGGLCYYFNDEKLGKVEFLAGAGFGKSEALDGYYFNFKNQIPSSPYNYGNFTRLYIQPGMGHSFNNFELTISSRFSWVNVTQIRSTSYSQNALGPKIRGFFIEPAFPLEICWSIKAIVLSRISRIFSSGIAV